MRMSRLHATEDTGPSPRRAAPSEVEQRTFDFGVAVLRLVRQFDSELPRPVAENLVSVGAEIGAAAARANTFSSRRASLNRMIASRAAAREVDYWLRLVVAADLIPNETVAPLLDEARSLQNVLTGLCIKARQAMDAEEGK